MGQILAQVSVYMTLKFRAFWTLVQAFKVRHFFRSPPAKKLCVATSRHLRRHLIEKEKQEWLIARKNNLFLFTPQRHNLRTLVPLLSQFICNGYFSIFNKNIFKSKTTFFYFLHVISTIRYLLNIIILPLFVSSFVIGVKILEWIQIHNVSKDYDYVYT